MDVQKLGVALKEVLGTRGGVSYHTILEGDLAHPHQFQEVTWDPQHGEMLMDLEEKDALFFKATTATFRDLERCSCGAERIKSKRALV